MCEFNNPYWGRKSHFREALDESTCNFFHNRRGMESFLRRAREARAREDQFGSWCSCPIPAPDEQHDCNNCGRKVQSGVRCKTHNRVICEECNHDGERG